MKILSGAVFILLAFMQVTAAASKIFVIDGDSIRLGKREVRLEGIDAPEYHQNCFDASGKAYGCGIRARNFLISLVGDDLRCEKKTIDRYGREVSVCFSNGINLNQQMVAAGQAVAYDRYGTNYTVDEKNARENKRGIWQGRFMKPELYRILQKD